MTIKRTSKSVILALLLTCSGCSPSHLTFTDFADLLHALEIDIHAWWYQMNQPVIARVNGHRITATDFRVDYEKWHSGEVQWLATPEGRRRLLETLIRHKLPVVAAEEAGLDRESRYFQELPLVRRDLLYNLYRDRLELTEPMSEKDLQALYKTELSQSGHRPLPYNPETLRRNMADRLLDNLLTEKRSMYQIWIDSHTLDTFSFHANN